MRFLYILSIALLLSSPCLPLRAREGFQLSPGLSSFLSTTEEDSGGVVEIPFRTLSGTLHRELVDRGISEVIWGEFYYAFPDYFYLHVKHPVNQIVSFRKGSMVIFYPDERKAFEMKSDRHLSLPFVQAFQVLSSDLGLSKLGYELIAKEDKADTLVTRWVPKGKKPVGGVVIKKVKGMILSLTVLNRDGEKVAETFYNDYSRYGSVDIPKTIISLSHAQGDTLRETITYGDVKLNLELPEDIADFRLPEGVKAEVIEWK